MLPVKRSRFRLDNWPGHFATPIGLQGLTRYCALVSPLCAIIEEPQGTAVQASHEHPLRNLSYVE